MTTTRDPALTTLLCHPQPLFTLPTWHNGSYGKLRLRIIQFKSVGLPIAVILVDTKGGVPARLSIDIENIAQVLPIDHFLLKSYNENEGLLEALTAAGVIADTGARYPGPNGGFPIVRLLPSYIPPMTV